MFIYEKAWISKPQNRFFFFKMQIVLCLYGHAWNDIKLQIDVEI